MTQTALRLLWLLRLYGYTVLMALALYRKYRPQTFAELADQQAVKTTLLAQLEQDRVAHAYLFTGPRGVGKTTTARLLAKAVNCTGRKDGEPCNRCESCRRYLEGKELDLFEIDAASHTGVENVRENVIEAVRFQPSQAKVKVYIIDEVHMLSTPAFNALLKTLEEPPAHVLFVLATTEVQKVPETIISRCQRFDFRKIPGRELTKRLEKIAKAEGLSISSAVVQEIARRADGSSRDAEVLLSQFIALGEKQITEEIASLVLPRSDRATVEAFCADILRRDRLAAIDRLARYVDEGGDLTQLIEDLIIFIRNVLLSKVRSSPESFERGAEFERLIELVPVDEFERMLNVFLKRRLDLPRALIPQLPLELAILELTPDVERVPPVVTSPVAHTAELVPTPKAARPDSSPKRSALRKSSTLELVTVRQKWPEVIAHLRKHNHSLALTMKVSEILAFENGELTLGFAYPFYLDRITEAKNQTVIELVLEDIFGEPIRVRGKVVSDGLTPKSESSLWEQVSSAFSEAE